MSTRATVASQAAGCLKKGLAPWLLSALAMACTSTCLAANGAPNQAYQKWVNNLGTTQLAVGATLAQQVTVIQAACNVNFSWQTSVPKSAGGKWSVTNAPNGPALAAGFVSYPGPGLLAHFSINFASFAPSKPPSSPTTYFVTIAPVGADQKGLGLPSNPVRVTYSH